jgi:hypothetical protein
MRARTFALGLFRADAQNRRRARALRHAKAMSSTATPDQPEHPAPPENATNVPPRVLAIRQHLRDSGLSPEGMAAIESPLYVYLYWSWELVSRSLAGDRSLLAQHDGARSAYHQQLDGAPLSVAVKIVCERLADDEAVAASFAGVPNTAPPSGDPAYDRAMARVHESIRKLEAMELSGGG